MVRFLEFSETEMAAMKMLLISCAEPGPPSPAVLSFREGPIKPDKSRSVLSDGFISPFLESSPGLPLVPRQRRLIHWGDPPP
jgi:hypothetical protein